MKKVLRYAMCASLVLLVGACANNADVTPPYNPISTADQPAGQEASKTDTPVGYNAYENAVDDTSYTKDKVSTKTEPLYSSAVAPKAAVPVPTPASPSAPAPTSVYPVDKDLAKVSSPSQPGLDSFVSAVTDTSYVKDPVSEQAGEFMSSGPDLVKPSPKLETSPKLVTGQDPAVAAQAGYPVVDLQKAAVENKDQIENIQGMGDLVSALTDTSYMNDQVSTERKPVYDSAPAVSPSPALESSPKLVTGQDPAVAAQAGYPVADLQKESEKTKSSGQEGLSDLMSALTDTSYENDPVSTDVQPMSTKY